MTYAPDKPKEQHFFHSGVTWERFKSIQAGFADSPGIRLFYYRGEVEIVSVSPEHEIISGIIAILLAIYFEEKGVEFTPTGSFTQERKQEASAQADQSYFIGDLGTTPDLSIEVVFSSGGSNKLSRYQILGVPEVWFWEDGLFTLHRLEGQGYKRIYQSEVLKELDVDLLTRCILMAQTSRLDAIRTFRKGVQGN